MNIGFVVDNEFNNDIRVRKEVRILKEYGYNIYIICFGFDNKTYSNIEGINIERIRIRKKVKDILFFFFNRLPLYEFIWKHKIKKFIRRNSIDVLHAHDLYMSKASYSAIQLSQRECPMILDLHENYPVAVQSYNWTKGKVRNYLSNPKGWAKKEKEYLKYASQLIVLSDLYKDYLMLQYEFLTSQNIVVFPNVIDFRSFEKYIINTFINKKKDVTLLYFGAVAERRGIFDAIDAIQHVLNKGIMVNLLIIGPIDKADKKKFKYIINEPVVKDHIEYIPYIDISELVTYMHISDVCLAPFLKNPQHESGVANKIFQYMYGGKPIIASSCRPQQELIESSNCGFIYSTQEEFIDYIILLVEDQNLRKRLGENGYNELLKNYNTNKFVDILIDLYKIYE